MKEKELVGEPFFVGFWGCLLHLAKRKGGGGRPCLETTVNST